MAAHRLTASEVCAARQSDETDAALAERYGVSSISMFMARRGLTHASLDLCPPMDPPGPRKGEKHHNARLTEAAVCEIRNSTASNLELAFNHRVHPMTVKFARTGRTWKHVACEDRP
jgi:hypothetical protein